MDVVRNDRIEISKCVGDMMREPRLRLVFWDVRQGKSPRQLWSFLLDEEVSDASAATQAIRYTADTQTVSFWLRRLWTQFSTDRANGRLTYGGPTSGRRLMIWGLPMATLLGMGDNRTSNACVGRQ